MENNPQVNQEGQKKKFIYRDNFKDREVVFECEASGILEADQMYKEKTGNDVSRQAHIACSIEELEKQPRP